MAKKAKKRKSKVKKAKRAATRRPKAGKAKRPVKKTVRKTKAVEIQGEETRCQEIGAGKVEDL